MIAPDASVWFTDPGIDSVGRISPSGTLTQLALPSPSGPAGIASDAGGIWFTQNDRNAIGRLALEPPHVLEELFLPTAAAQPFAIALGHDGDVWFTEIGANQIGRIALDRTITEYPIPTNLAVPAGIAVAGDGAVWFTEFNRNQIGRLDPDGSFEEIPLPNPASSPFGIAVDSNDMVFFTQLNGNRIGRVAADGAYSEFPVPTASSQPAGIAIGADGRVWFTQINADQIGVLDGDLVHEVAVPSGSFEGSTLFGGGIASRSAGGLAFAASAAAAIDRIEGCESDGECTTGNCEAPLLLCGPPHTPTRPASVSPTLSRTPTSTATPSASTTTTPSATIEPTASDTPTETATVTQGPTSTPTLKRNGGNHGCHIDPEAPARSTWLQVLPVLLAMGWRTRRGGRRARTIAIVTLAVIALSIPPAFAGEPTSTTEPIETPTPTASATATSTRAATATPHLVEFRIGSTVAGPGDAAYVEVSTTIINAAAAAVVHEITFPSEILGLEPAHCYLNPLIPKTLRANFAAEGEDETTVRVVIESSRNLHPLQDGLLYTCTFLVSPLALPTTYAVTSGLASAYSATGAEINNVRGVSGAVTISLIGDPCTGDCDGGGRVTVDEILTGIGIALGVQPMGTCPRFDADVSGDITVDELVSTVNNALNGCNLPPPPLPTPTPTAAPQRTAIFVRLNGDDANSGLTPSRALRTISHAARLAPSGYRIVVGPGLYVDGITTDGQGRASEDLMFEADVSGAQTGDPAGPVVIDASESPLAAAFRLTKAVGTVIDGFTITGGADAGIVIKSDSDDFVIRNCIFYGNPGAGIRVQDSARTLVFNNLIYSNGREGIAIVGQGSGSADARVINNTVWGNSDRALRIGTSSTGSPGALVRNNIFQDNGIGFVPVLENVKVFPTSEPDYDGDFNLVFPASYLPFDLVGDHDVAADAEFLSAVDSDFRISFSSPAIDAGGPLPGDLESQLGARSATGTNLDDGAPDLGYHFAP